jgi:hypothetical protein
MQLVRAMLPLVDPSSDPSSRFGTEVRTLAKGNIVVTDAVLTVNKVPAVGAACLFNGPTGALIGTLTGTPPARPDWCVEWYRFCFEPKAMYFFEDSIFFPPWLLSKAHKTPHGMLLPTRWLPRSRRWSRPRPASSSR